MRFQKLDDLYKNVLFQPVGHRYWFFQLLVWLDVLSPEVPKCVIETGTNLGYGAYTWSMFFDEVHTVELSEKLYNQAKNTYGHVSNITFYNDTSDSFLAEVLPTKTESCIIFLDAHGSGGETTFDDRDGRFGSPIIRELQTIKQHSTRNDHIILIDDLEDCALPDYPSKNDIREALLDINPDYHIELDLPLHLMLSRGTGMAVVL